MRAGPYVPQPGTIPHKVVAYLQAQLQQGRRWVSSAELSEHAGQPSVSPFLGAPLKHGVLVSRRKADNQRLIEYSLGEGKPLPDPPDLEPDEPIAPKPAARRNGVEPPPWPPTGSKAAEPPQAERPPKPGRKVRGPAAGVSHYTDVQGMQIVNDPIIGRSVGGGDKYGPLFAKIKIGQAIKCQPEDTPKVANAMRKWRDDNKVRAVVQSVRRYPADGLGRVWLLPAKDSAQ